MSERILKFRTPLIMIEYIKSFFDWLSQHWVILSFFGALLWGMIRLTKKKYPEIVEFTKTTKVILELRTLITSKFDELFESNLVSRSRIDFITDVSVTAFWRANAKGQLVYVNDAFCEMFGKDCDELLGEGWLNVIESEDFDRTVKKWQMAISSQSQTVIEFNVVTTHGIKKCKTCCYAHFNSKGEFVEFQGVTRLVEKEAS